MKKTKLWLALGATLFSASLATPSFAGNTLDIDYSKCPANSPCGLNSLISGNGLASGDTLKFDEGTFTFDASESIGTSGLIFTGAGKAKTLLDGGASFFVNQTPKAIENLTIQNFKASNEGAVIYSDGDIATRFEKVKFFKNAAANDGGVFYTKRNFSGSILNSDFLENSANGTNGRGGALNIQGSFTGSIAGSVFEGNTASTSSGQGQGGAIYVRNSFSGKISSSIFTGNLAQGSGSVGGAIYMMGLTESGRIIDSSFTDNSAASNGGAIQITTPFNGADVFYGQIIRSNFTKNSANNFGGAIYIQGKFSETGRIIESSFTDNSVFQFGGAIYVMNNFAGQIIRSSFTNNSSKNIHGGAITVFSMNQAPSDFTETGLIINSSFTGNSAMNYGGAIYLSQNFAGQISHSSFINNIATNAGGGAIAISSAGTGQISDSIFTGNTTRNGTGGAIYVGSKLSGQICDSIFAGNTTKINGSGGAIYISGVLGASTAPSDFSGTKFFNNSAKSPGGAIYAGGNVYLSAHTGDVTFAGNANKNGGTNLVPNAMFFSYGNSISLSAAEGKTIYFYDPISSGGSNLTLDFNAKFNSSGVLDGATNGTILFDGGVNEQGALGLGSDIYFGKGATLHGGTMILQNGATFGGAVVQGSYQPNFTVASGATLLVQYEQDSPLRDADNQVELNQSAQDLDQLDVTKMSDAEIKTALEAAGLANMSNVAYDPGHVSTLNANLALKEGASLAFKLPEGQGEGEALFKVNGDVEFEGGSIINIETYTESQEEGGNKVKLLDANSLAGDFKNQNGNGVKLELGGEAADETDYIRGTLEQDGNALYVQTFLAWNTRDSKSHGTFTLKKESDVFDVDAVLKDQPGNTGWNDNSLTKKGEGTLILSAQNTYTGETKVEGGTLEIGEKGALLNSKVTTDEGTTLTVKGEVLKDISIGKNGSFNVSGTVGNATIASGATVDVSGISGNLNIDSGAKVDVSGTSGDLSIGSDSKVNLSGTSGATGIGSKSTIDFSGVSGNMNIGSGSTIDFAGASDDLTFEEGVTMNIAQKAKQDDSSVARKTRGAVSSPEVRGDFKGDGSVLNFALAPDAESGDVLLTVRDNASVDKALVNLSLSGNLAGWGTGDYVDLIHANKLEGVYREGKVKGLRGSTIIYDFELESVDEDSSGDVDTLRATMVGAGRAADESSSLAEGWLGGLAMLQTGSDAAANAIDEAKAVAQRGEGVIPFGKISGGKSEFTIGDGVNLRHFNYLAGLAYGKRFAPGAMTVGAFFEHGQGNFDTSNVYADVGTVRGDGKAHYEGAGVLGRFEFGGASHSTPSPLEGEGWGEGGNSHAYVEASLRAGRLTNDYTSRNLEDAFGVKAKYKTSSNYFGGHVGGGYIFELAEKTHVDVYGKFLWTRVGGKSVTLSTGEDMKFDAMHSERARAGAKWTTQVTKQVAPYVGIAYEYAFNGKAKSEVDGYRLDAPQMKGGTGIVNAGMSFAPGATVPLFIDLDVSGYAGKRQGVAGGVKLKYTW